MEYYTKTCYQLARQLTEEYSTSFSLSSRFFSKTIRDDIYAIYGMLRVSDEIVDTYQGDNAGALLAAFEKEILAQINATTAFSTNPIVQAFVHTARRSGIDISLIAPFFESMRSDITQKTFNQSEYNRYIYGSAEVVGLMCLKVFTKGDVEAYDQLAPSAQALSRAYQKVNFLRDIAEDFKVRQRHYFPASTYDSFDDATKKLIEQDIAADFTAAHGGIEKLPSGARKAVALSYKYYYALFEKLTATSAAELKAERVRLPSLHKTQILAKHLLKNGTA